MSVFASRRWTPDALGLSSRPHRRKCFTTSQGCRPPFAPFYTQPAPALYAPGAQPLQLVGAHRVCTCARHSPCDESLVNPTRAPHVCRIVSNSHTPDRSLSLCLILRTQIGPQGFQVSNLEEGCFRLAFICIFTLNAKG